MIIEETRLWFTLFSKIFIQLIVGNRQVSQSQASENAVQDLGPTSISGYLAV